MLALEIIGAIILLIVLINLIPVGADISYADGETRVSAKICGKLIQLYPKPPDDGKKMKKGKKPKEEEKPPEQAEEKEAKPKRSLPKDFSKEELLELLKIGLRTAGSFRRKLQIDHFRLWFVSSDPDPYWTIMIYNYVNDALCVLGALAENAFRVKDSDIRTATDFDVGEPFIEVRLALSIRIGQIVCVALAAGIAALKILLRHRRRQKKMLKEQLAA